MLKNLRKITTIIAKNYFVSALIALVMFVGLVSLARVVFKESNYIYARVKVSQGLWWASTQKPSIWYAKAIKKGDVETGLNGEPMAEVMKVRYYPWGQQSQFETYMDVRLKVSYSGKIKKYFFKRSTLTVASPVDFEFPSAVVSGTVVKISENPFTDNYVEKVVTLTKKSAYPWEYESIDIGSSYYDGEQIVLNVIDKKALSTSTYSDDSFGNYPVFAEQRKYVTVKIKMKLHEDNEELVFAEEMVIGKGRNFSFFANDLSFDGYTISHIEDF